MLAWAEERVCFMREGWYQIYDCLGCQVRLVVTLSTDNAQFYVSQFHKMREGGACDLASRRDVH